MKTRRRTTGKKFLALLLVALLAISPIASDLPQLAITVDAEETDSSDDTNLVDSLAAYYSFDGTLENSVTSNSARVQGGAGDTWTAETTGGENYNSTNSVSGSSYSFSGNQSAASETISGRTWWEDTETGQNYAITDGGSLSFTVTATADVSGYAAFSTEIYDASNHYLTTGSDGNAWFTEAEGTVNCTAGASAITAGVTYIVTVSVTPTDEGTEFTVVYYDQDEESVFATITAVSDTVFDSTVNVHFIAQVGTFDIAVSDTAVITDSYAEYLEEIETDETVDCSNVKIDSGFSASTGEMTLSGDFVLTYTFTNTSTGSDNWDNFIVEMYSLYTTTDDDGNEMTTNVYLDVRADNYGWLANNDSSDTVTFGDGADDWDIWNAAMKAGYECTVTVKRIGTTVVVTSTCGGATFTATASVSEYDDDAQITVHLTGEECVLTDVSYTVYDWVYENLTITNGFSAHTGEIILSGDFEVVYTFNNTCNDTTCNWYNFILEMVSSDVYLDIRADNYGWITGGSEDDTLTFRDGASNWSTWLSSMAEGYACTVTITRSGEDIGVTLECGGSTFTATAYVSEYNDDAEITMYLTGEQCTISDVSASVSTLQLTTLENSIDTTTTSGEGLMLDVSTSDSFTVSGWVYAKQKLNYQSMYFVVRSSDDYINVGTIFNDCWTAALAMVGGWGGTVLWVDNSSKDIEIGEWTYVTLTVTSDGAVTYYLNGEQVNSASFGDAYGNEFSNVPIYLGVNYWNDSFSGLMDELTVYSAALTADEVATLYALDGDPDAAAEAEESGETWNAISRVTVHDPSIVKGYVDSSVTSVLPSTTVVPEATGSYTKEIYFVFGSHLAFAYSWDLTNWYYFTNNLTTDYDTIFESEFAWASTGDSVYANSGNMWAPDVIYNEELGKWCMYMSINGCSWNSCICMLTADTLLGDWTYVGPIVYSGFDNGNFTGLGSEDYMMVTSDSSVADRYITSGYYCKDGTTYCSKTTWNTDYGAHAIDPCVIYDEDGNLWMSYGSWSGGIYLLKLSESTGLRDYDYSYGNEDYEENSYDAYMGYKLAGGNGYSGEASYLQYVETGDNEGYYFLYVSYGGYTAAGGYNMRLFRCTDITGQTGDGYVDVTGDSAKYTADWADNINGSTGLRLLSYYKYSFQDLASTAQGHNSMLVDDDGNMYVVYHTRSNDGTEGHQLRVRQLFVTEDGWLASAPFEYTGDADTGTFQTYEIAGTYEVIFHESTDYNSLGYNSGISLTFATDGTVSGDKSGTWNWSESLGSPFVDVTIDEVVYQGLFLKQSKEENSSIYSSAQVMAFTLVTSSTNSNSSLQELCVWGYMTEAATSTVTVTSRSTDSAGTVADVSGGGNYTIGDSVTVTAPSKSEYTFKGWYTAETDSDGEVSYQESGLLTTNLEYTLIAEEENISLIAVYEADSGSIMSLTVKCDNLNGATYTVTAGSQVQISGTGEDYTGYYAAGTSITLTANDSSNATFAYWTNGSLKIVNTSTSYTFVIVADTTIYPVYNTSDSESNTAIVDYVTYYGQVLKRATYSSGNTIEVPGTSPSRTGYTFSGWSYSTNDISSMIGTGNYTYIKVTPKYTQNEIKTYTVNVYADGSAQLTSSESGAAGETLTVNAPTVEGKTFCYWATAESEGTILSYKESYMVYLSRDIDLYAVYTDSSSAENTDSVSTIVMTNVYAVTETTSGSDTDSGSTTYKIAFEATRSVLDSYEVVETGMLYSTNSECSEDDLDVGAETEYVTRYSSSSTERDGVFTLYVDVTDSNSETGYSTSTIYARGYVVVSDGNKLIKYYTDVFAKSYSDGVNAE